MRHATTALLLTIALLTLAGCGQMGPLYLPPAEARAEKPAEPPGTSPQPPGTP